MKLLEFKYEGGEPVAVNLDQVTHVEPDSTKRFTCIYFDGADHYIVVDVTYSDVIARITQAYEL